LLQLLKKNPNERLSLEGVMKHHWISKFAKVDLNITNQNLTLNSSLGNFGSNTTNSSASSSTASNGSMSSSINATVTTNYINKPSASSTTNTSTSINNNNPTSMNKISTNATMNAQYSIKTSTFKESSSGYYQK
jgi:hypothetical protein